MEVVRKTLTVILILISFLPLNAEQSDIFDYDPLQETNQADQEKSSEQLIREAILLMSTEPINARSKLQLALKKNPESIEAMKILGAYYLDTVGHFRLALKYIKKAEQVFLKKYGEPPYFSSWRRYLHSDLLRLLSYARLNLDNYEGALETVNASAIYGYIDSFHAPHKAWILFKMGRIEDAIQVARQGLRSRANQGATLNVLAILLSVSGQREEAIEVFEEAIEVEKRLGQFGQPATPLNNIGEVYRETFSEENASLSWNRAVRLPDGCEHVLPSLNLFVINIEALKFSNAKKAIDNFEVCFQKKYPLKNGEENRALIQLARGRLAMHTGKVDQAIQNFQEALDRQQWFGKIGTNVEDLQAALIVSLAQALTRKNNHLRTKPYTTFGSWVHTKVTIYKNSLLRKWYFRKARKLLTQNLNNFEDAFVRHTDSILEYPSLGELFATFPKFLAKKHIKKLKKNDPRNPANLYYDAYLAENLLRNGNKKEAKEMLKEIINDQRSKYDSALKTHCQLLLLSSSNSNEHIQTVQKIYLNYPGLIRNYGLRLAVRSINIPTEIRKTLDSGAFKFYNKDDLHLGIKYQKLESMHKIELVNIKSGYTLASVSDKDLEIAIETFTNIVFQQKV